MLSDADQRARNTIVGDTQAFGAGFNPFAGHQPRDFEFGDVDISELFNMFAGGGRVRGGQARDVYGGGFAEAFGGMFGGGAGYGARPRPRRGNDLRLEVSVPFREAATGSTVEMVIPRIVGGGGNPRREDRVKVRIPAGIDDGATLRIAGKGDAGPGGGPPGDALLTVRVEADSRFRREGRNLVVDVPIGIATAALGGQATVPTMNGDATITIPAGTASAQRLRLKGKGVPAGGGKPAGDLFAVIQIRPPKSLDADSRALLEQFRERNE